MVLPNPGTEMFRLFFTYVLPLIGPTLVYLAWNWIQMRRALAGKRPNPPPSFSEMPWPFLLGAGVSLLIVTLLALFLITDSGRPGEIYVPPRFEDGRIVPGESR